jgi:hypothetical protein
VLVISADVHDAVTLLDDIEDRLDDGRDMLALVKAELEDYEGELFATQGFGQWAPNDPATVLLKGSARVLVDTGNLLEQVTRAQIDGDDVGLDISGAPYAKFLAAGARGTPKRHPAPTPDGGRVERWAEYLLGFIVDGEAR